MNLFATQDHTYKASFGDGWLHLGWLNHGFAVTGSKALTRKVSHTNCALFGPTGSGKSSTVIISSVASLARGRSSIIINDVSGEVYEHTSTFLARKGYKILRLNFSEPLHSETFNPLQQCATISDIQKMALLIVRNAIGESKGDVFWEQSAVMLISLFARYLIFHTRPQFRTLQNVLRLIERFAISDKAVDKRIVQAHDEDLFTAYKATLVMGEKTLQSVIATARTALSLFSDLQVCKTTGSNSIDFTKFREEPTALYVCNPLRDLLYYKPLSALFFQSLFNHVLSRIPSKKERSIFFLLDEAATMRFPSLSTTISNIRKFNAGILLCMQDEMSLISQYGQAEAHQIKTNCGTQVYLKGQPLHTCTELSKILGRYSYTDDRSTERVRELMTPDELRITDKAVILINNALPLLCTPVPYFENIWLSHLAHNNGYQLSNKTVIEPSLLPMV